MAPLRHNTKNPTESAHSLTHPSSFLLAKFLFREKPQTLGIYLAASHIPSDASTRKDAAADCYKKKGSLIDSKWRCSRQWAGHRTNWAGSKFVIRAPWSRPTTSRNSRASGEVHFVQKITPLRIPLDRPHSRYPLTSIRGSKSNFSQSWYRLLIVTSKIACLPAGCFTHTM